MQVLEISHNLYHHEELFFNNIHLPPLLFIKKTGGGEGFLLSCLSLVHSTY